MAVLPPIRIVVAGQDLSATAQNISWSNGDPGGCQMASFEVDSNQANLILPGNKVQIFDGADCTWIGRVAEPAPGISHGLVSRARHVGHQTTRIDAEGAGAVAKDNDLSGIIIDRDLGRWQGPSVERQFGVIPMGWVLGSFQTGVDPTNLKPSIVFQLPSAPYVGKPLAEAWYDAGPGNLVGAMWVAQRVSNQPLHWKMDITGSVDDTLSSSQVMASFNTTPNSTFIAVPKAYRWIDASAYSPDVGAGTDAGTSTAFMSLLPIVFGDHGLPIRTDSVGNLGFYTSDIAAWAARKCAGRGVSIGQVDAVTTYVVTDYKQYDPVNHQTWIEDMAKLAPAHYGWWPSSDIFSDGAEFTFRQYGTTPTAFCSLSDCDEADLSQRLANMYNIAVVTYRDAAGTQFRQTVALPNGILDRQSLTRTVTYDLGTSSAQAANAFASFALQALYQQARTVGTLTVPHSIRDSSGAALPSRRLRSGIDRLRVGDLPLLGSLIPTTDTDSFRIARVENTVDSSAGQVVTRLELDSGPSLIETLQARVDAATRAGGG